METRIHDFIREHHVLSLATGSGEGPWVCSCFYAWVEEEGCFIFTSDKNTRHILDIEKDRRAAGAVHLETEAVGKIRGVQFSGRVYEPLGAGKKKYRKVYLKRFPYAVLVQSTVWVLRVETLKMTDNRLGFGKKLIWEREKDATIKEPVLG